MAPWWFPPAMTAQARNCQGSQHMQFLWKRSVGREEKKERPICAETVKLRPAATTGHWVLPEEAASWGHSVYTWDSLCSVVRQPARVPEEDQRFRDTSEDHERFYAAKD